MKQQSKAMKQQSNISHFFHTHLLFCFASVKWSFPLCNGTASWHGPFLTILSWAIGLKSGSKLVISGRKGIKEVVKPRRSTAHEPFPGPSHGLLQYKCVSQTPVEGTSASTPALGWVSTRASRRGLSSGWGQNSDAQVSHSPEQTAHGQVPSERENRTVPEALALCGPNKLRDRDVHHPPLPSAPLWRAPSALSLHDPTAVSSLACRSREVRQWTAPLPHIPGWTQRLSPVNTYWTEQTETEQWTAPGAHPLALEACLQNSGRRDPVLGRRLL